MSRNALNAICPYYTMYPLSFPDRVLKEHGKPGDWVLDPFCGRGTTNFAARLRGMPSIGIDSSPVAAALAEAKLATATPGNVMRVARRILASAPEPVGVPTGDFWRLAYHERTLVQLVQMRDALLADCSSPSRVLLRAIILGALHGPRPKGRPSYFSNQAPRTFAPKPAYAVKFWRANDMSPDEVDPLAIIGVRAKRYLANAPGAVDGRVLLGDSRLSTTYDRLPKSRFVVTSPPYFGMRTYLPDQWLRLWFLGGANYVEYQQPADQLSHTSADHFASELARVWTNAAHHTSDDARLVIRYGGIHDRNADPMDVLKRSIRGTGWRMKTARVVPDVNNGRRQVRQFQANPKQAKTEYDVYCHRDG